MADLKALRRGLESNAYMSPEEIGALLDQLIAEGDWEKKVILLQELQRLLDQEREGSNGTRPKSSGRNCRGRPAYFWFLNS